MSRCIVCSTFYCHWGWAVSTLIVATATVEAAEFIPLGFLPGESESRAYNVSDDGKTVIGASPRFGANRQAFRWSDSSGMMGLDEPGFLETGSTFGFQVERFSGDGTTLIGYAKNEAGSDVRFIHTPVNGMQVQQEVFMLEAEQSFGPIAVSFNGTVMVGGGNLAGDGTIVNDGLNHAARWSVDEGLIGLGHLDIPGHAGSVAELVSADGSVIVGQSFDPGGPFKRFIWTQDAGMLPLPNASQLSRNPTEMSADGKVLGGRDSITSLVENEAYRWTEETGAIGLGLLSGTSSSETRGINEDGSVIVGRSYGGSPSRAFIWTEESGMRDLYEVLVEQGLGDELTGWNLSVAIEISANGQYIVGWGGNPDGNEEGWLVRLNEPIPEPSTSFLTVLGSIVLVGARCRYRS